jgi:hypothetical protein
MQYDGQAAKAAAAVLENGILHLHLHFGIYVLYSKRRLSKDLFHTLPCVNVPGFFVIDNQIRGRVDGICDTPRPGQDWFPGQIQFQLDHNLTLKESERKIRMMMRNIIQEVEEQEDEKKTVPSVVDANTIRYKAPRYE